MRDFVKITLPPEELAYCLTFAGLEVEDIEYVGLAPQQGNIDGLPTRPDEERKAKGIAWERDKLVVAQILEVLPHPNADRLTLLRLDDGLRPDNIVLTGAPNIFHLNGRGPLPQPLKVAYAREGARIYDGHQPGRVLMTLKRAKIRGVESSSMACSEKELGISDDHTGIIILDDDAPVGLPLADYMGDVVFTVKINPNMARAACVLGVAREIAALTGQKLRAPEYAVRAAAPALKGRLTIEIREPELNPRFTAALIEGVTIRPSPYWVQRRLRLAGMRPINNIVDATNYVMLEIGEPLHAFDWDALMARARAAGGPDAKPRIITRLPHPGETLKTLDGVERQLDAFNMLVCDQSGALSLAGVMGGAESEVSERTANVLLEGACWDFINIRRTAQAHKLISEASYRFSRGVHPATTERGVKRGIELMRQWAGGLVAKGLIDVYPRKAKVVKVDLTPADVERTLGVRLSVQEIVRLLEALEFHCEIRRPPSSRSKKRAGRPMTPAGERQTAIRVTVPDHRLDIGAGVIGRADLIEEIARIYGYEKFPETQLADTIPPQRGNPALEWEERARDLLVAGGLQEVITYALTSIEREQRLFPGGMAEEVPYVTLANPVVVDRVVMRHYLLTGLLEVLAANSRVRERQALFEIGPVYLPRPGELLPAEPRRLAIALTGPRQMLNWQGADRQPMDFFDLKGQVEVLVDSLHLEEVVYEPARHSTFIPGRTARLLAAGQPVGWLGEVHPLVLEKFDLPPQPVLAAELDLDILLSGANERHTVSSVPVFPPVKEDIAIVLNDDIPAAQVEAVIRQAGGDLLAGVMLFDLFRGGQIGPGKKSMAFSLTYQAPERTLTDEEAAKVRHQIIERLQAELGAVLRS